MNSRSILAASVVVACGALSASPAATAGAGLRIHDIQGTTRLSELDGQRVTEVPGVVTGIRSFGEARGFWFQDPQPDDDPRTSEGLFVYTGSQTPDVAVGDQVTVSGEVSEYYPLGSGETPETTANQSVTQFVDASWTSTGTGTVPEAEALMPDAVPAQLAPRDGNIEKLELDPAAYALDYYEAREGMNLRIDDARVVGPTDDYHALWVTSKPEQNANGRGGTTYTDYAEPNTGRLKVESLLPFSEVPFPVADVGDELRGTTAGPLDYSGYGGYVLAATALGEHVPGELEPESTAPQGDDQLAVATYNVENLAATDEQEKFDRLARGVVAHLAAPDVITLEEVQDNTGATDDGVVEADGTLARFTEAVEAAGGPRYEWRQIDPVDNADGGQPGGNIRVAFLFNPERVSFEDVEGGDATTPTRPVESGGGVALSASPGRIDPADEAWADSRKPLVGQFSFGGRRVFVVANHFSSKGGGQPLHGRFQPPERSSEEQRLAQARSVRGFVDELLAIDPAAEVVVAGDLNDFGFSESVGALTEGGALTNPADSLDPVERYSYVYEGNSQALDHILTSRGVGTVEYDVVHINAEFADQASDHDPQLIRING